MNLKSCFNLKYACQNLKKSKGVLALFLGIFPIINSLVLLLLYSDNFVVPSLIDMSILNIIGLYILPIVISICLFQYVFKKKSVDFIGSMPISRKNLFLTNTMTGILLIFLMQVINIILILLIGVVTSSVIPYRMLFDYFVIWSISYIFVFLVSNVSISISGNMMTSIVVTFILLFVFPFLSDYTVNKITCEKKKVHFQIECREQSCKPDVYSCYGDRGCLRNEQQGIYEVDGVKKVRENNHPLPCGLFQNSLEKVKIYNPSSLIHTIFLFFIFFLLGFYLFLHKKLENNETSFKSDKMHALVKGLPLAPVILLCYRSIGEIITLVLFGTLVIGYYFLFDLITRRRVGKLFPNLGYLIITVLVILVFDFGIDMFFCHEDNYLLSSKEIASIEFMDDNISISNEKYPVLEDKKIINRILKATLNERVSGKDYRDYPVLLKTTSGKLFKYNLVIEQEELDSLEEAIVKGSDYIKYRDFSNTNFYLYQVGQNGVAHRLNSEIEKEFKKVLRGYRKDQFVSDAVYIEEIRFVAYQNGELISVTLPCTVSPTMEKLVIDEITKQNHQVFQLLKDDAISFDRVGSSFIDFDYEYYYLLRNMENEVFDFVKRYKDEKFNLYENYLILADYSGNQFITNRVDEFLNLLKGAQEKLKDDPEYIRWLEDNKVDTILGEDSYVAD